MKIEFVGRTDQHVSHKVALDIHPHERQTATFLDEFYPDIMANRIAIVSEKDTPSLPRILKTE